MVLRVFGDNASGFTLHNSNDVQIGWIEDRALGFRCFLRLDDAEVAARVAYDTIRPWCARSGVSMVPPRIRDAPLHLVNDGAYEWFASDRVPVARLLRPRADVASDRGLYGIELVIPRGIGAVAAIGGAQVIYSALTRQLPDAVLHAAEEPYNVEFRNTDNTVDVARA